MILRTALTMTVAGLLLLAGPARGQTTADWQLATGLGAGAVSPDQSLANYRWDTRPAALYALQAAAVHGRLGLGLRFSRWRTTQGTGLATGSPDPRVQLNDLALVAQYRAFAAAGCEMWASALAGRLGIAWSPDQQTIPTAVPGTDLTVDYDPLSAWSLGAGLEIRRNLGRRLTAAVLGEWSRFQLDTSHRRGDEIVTAREDFTNWSLRVQVSWTMDLGRAPAP